MDDHSHLVFVQNHISEMLELLADQDGIPRISGNHTGHLSLRAVEALGGLLDGSVDKLK